LTFWVSAEAATALASLLARRSRRIFEAFEATLLLVVSLALLVCVSAEAATALASLLAVLLLRMREAAEDTLLPVLSDLAIAVASLFQNDPEPQFDGGGELQIRVPGVIVRKLFRAGLCSFP
jgi:hypothetical protein